MGFIVNTVGGLLSGGAKKKASRAAQAAYNAAQEQAMAQARATQDAQEARLQPYSEAGKVGLANLSAGISNGKYTRPFSVADFQADPGYEFRKAEGLRALDRTINARGGLFSGAQIRGAQEYGQNIASEEYDKAYNRYNTDVGNDYTRTMGLANLGLGADAGIVDTLGTEGGNLRTSLIDIGGNNATGIRERGAITADMITGVVNNLNEAAQSIAMGGMGAGGMESGIGMGAEGGSGSITSLLSSLGIGNSPSKVATRSSGTSLSNLAKIFSKGGY